MDNLISPITFSSSVSFPGFSAPSVNRCVCAYVFIRVMVRMYVLARECVRVQVRVDSVCVCVCVAQHLFDVRKHERKQEKMNKPASRRG
jgi:hypothetical protein